MEEKIARNFGMSQPSGYRKALRVMQMAEKFSMPIITFIDTPGAYPGVDAEEKGQSEAIARNMFGMVPLRVPIICVVIGEGGSGGALAIGVGDRILMLEHSVYSVISPEGCASILWEDKNKNKQAADALCLTANHLLKFEKRLSCLSACADTFNKKKHKIIKIFFIIKKLVKIVMCCNILF